MEQRHERQADELKLVGYIVERIIGVRDKFIVSEVVALDEHLFVLFGETTDDFAEFEKHFRASDPEAQSWFCVRDFSSEKREHKNVCFEYYRAFDIEQRYASRVIPEYHRAIARAVTLSGGAQPIYDRRDA